MIKKLLLSSKNISKDSFIWNSISSYLNSFQTMILLLVLTHLGNDIDSSIFVMAYAVGNLVLNVGRYGTRQFQVTDVQEKYSYHDYVASRRFSMTLFSIAVIAYLTWGILTNGYTFDKALIIGLICFFKGIEAAEDVFHGRLQQQGRLDVATKITSIRFGVFIAGYALCYVVTRNLIFTTALNVAINFILCIVLNTSVAKEFVPVATGPATSRFFPEKLLLECLPLALTTILGMYLCNAPKYTIDGIVSDNVQTCFNIVFMPVFVVALLSNFVFNPYLRKLGELWANKEISCFKKLVLKLTFVPVGIDAVIILLGAFIGLPVLGFVYGMDLSNYLWELIIFLIVSGVISVLNLYAMVLTTLRKQGHLLYGYIAGALAMAIVSRPLLQSTDLITLCLLYLAILILVVIYCSIISFAAIHRQK